MAHPGPYGVTPLGRTRILIGLNMAIDNVSGPYQRVAALAAYLASYMMYACPCIGFVAFSMRVDKGEE